MKKNFKKVLTVLVALMMVMTLLAGCGGILMNNGRRYLNYFNRNDRDKK